MARDITKGICLDIEGKLFTIKLDLTAMKDFEDVTGRGVLAFIKPIFEAFRDMPAGTDASEAGIGIIEGLIRREAIRAGDVVSLFWACIGGPDSDLSIREAGRLIHAGNVVEVAGKLTDAVKLALPKSDGKAPDKVEPEGNA